MRASGRVLSIAAGRTIMIFSRIACLSVALLVPIALVASRGSPAFGAETVDKDGRPYGQKSQGGGARPAQPTQQPRQVPAQPAPQARPTAPVRQPTVLSPQRAAPIVRAPQAEPPRDRARVQFGGRPAEPRRYDGDGRRDAERYGQRRRFGLGAGVVIIGGLLGYELYRGSDRDDVFRRCDRNFADFDYESGSFVNEDGDREVCPYLLD